MVVAGYSARWSRAEAGAPARAAWLPGGEAALTLRRLACGARYRVELQAHNAAGASPYSAPLTARTMGDSEFLF